MARSFAQPGISRGFAANRGMGAGSIAGGRGFGMGRANPYGLGTRPSINTAGRFGGTSNFGRTAINSRAGTGFNATSLNRGAFANRSLTLNRTSAINNFNNFGNRAGFGGNRFGGYGYGRFGYGRFGYGGFGFGGFWPGFGFGFWPWFGWGGFWPGFGFGLGGGLWPWMYGSSLYNWGYGSYYNPYYGAGYGLGVDYGYGAAPVVYDYSQPIDTENPPAAPAVADQAATSFDSARDAFRTGDYVRASELIDQAIRQLPNDAALHEFRGVILFARQRYDEAAATLYAVLSVGPGWDWGTLIGLYPNVDVYTGQLRALEQYANQNPRSASARFVLAYLYITQGNVDAGVQELKQVVALQPKDTVAARLIQRLETTSNPAGAGAAQPPAQPPGPIVPTGANAAVPVHEGRMEGTWTAHPDQDTTISLTFVDHGRFSWKVAHKGQDREMKGKMTFGNGILTLAQDQGGPMVGNVTWTDETHFLFKVPGSGPDDPGLSFAKAP
jgi:tetratricopeptide (TPR) repeat protein